MISLTAVGAPPPRAPLSPLPSLLSPLSPPRLWRADDARDSPHMLATGLLASLALALRVATLARRAASRPPLPSSAALHALPFLARRALAKHRLDGNHARGSGMLA